jgi:hypothetical protein
MAPVLRGDHDVTGESEGKVVIVDTVTGEKLLSLGGHDGDATSVLVTADGTRILPGGEDSTVRVWDAETGAAVGEPLRGHDGWALSVAVTVDGTRIMSGSATMAQCGCGTRKAACRVPDPHRAAISARHKLRPVPCDRYCAGNAVASQLLAYRQSVYRVPNPYRSVRTA